MQDSVKPSSDETQYFRQHPAPPTFDFMDELKFKLKHKQQQISILENKYTHSLLMDQQNSITNS